MRVSRETLAAALVLALAAPPAAAATVSGGAALALAALVGSQSPTLKRYEKRAVALIFDGRLEAALPPGKTIDVAADAVSCRASNVDIALYSCRIGFPKAAVAVDGRRGHELFATLLEAGVKPEGGAGSITAGLTHLACTIDPNKVKERAGGGADCKFDAAAR